MNVVFKPIVCFDTFSEAMVSFLYNYCCQKLCFSTKYVQPSIFSHFPRLWDVAFLELEKEWPTVLC